MSAGKARGEVSEGRRHAGAGADVEADVHESCARSVAGDADLVFDASAAAPMVRGRADRAALVRAHHAPDVHAALAPRGAFAAALYDALEVERIEACGANRLRGVARNLDRLRGAEPERGIGPTGRLASLARAAFRGGTRSTGQTTTPPMPPPVPPPTRSMGSMRPTESTGQTRRAPFGSTPRRPSTRPPRCASAPR